MQILQNVGNTLENVVPEAKFDIINIFWVIKNFVLKKCVFTDFDITPIYDFPMFPKNTPPHPGWCKHFQDNPCSSQYQNLLKWILSNE